MFPCYDSDKHAGNDCLNARKDKARNRLVQVFKTLEASLPGPRVLKQEEIVNHHQIPGTGRPPTNVTHSHILSPLTVTIHTYFYSNHTDPTLSQTYKYKTKQFQNLNKRFRDPLMYHCLAVSQQYSSVSPRPMSGRDRSVDPMKVF